MQNSSDLAHFEMKILFFFFFSFFKINPSFSDKFYASKKIQEIILMQIDIFCKIFTPGPRYYFLSYFLGSLSHLSAPGGPAGTGVGTATLRFSTSGRP